LPVLAKAGKHPSALQLSHKRQKVFIPWKQISGFLSKTFRKDKKPSSPHFLFVFSKFCQTFLNNLTILKIPEERPELSRFGIGNLLRVDSFPPSSLTQNLH
jgi:hypothetical protein